MSRPDQSPFNPISIAPPLARLDAFPLRGRDELIRQILPNAKERPLDHKSVHVLHGIGGSGKSHVALGIARRFSKFYGHDRVWWIKLDRINSGMQALAATLGASRATIESAWTGGASAIDLVWALLGRQIRRWLLIIDNADVPRELAPDDGNVADGTGWLREPPRHLGLVVVTTKDGNAATWGDFSILHHVQGLPNQDGARILLELAPRAGGSDEAVKLAEALGGLPLALRGAGTYLKSVTEGNIWSGALIRSFEAYLSALKNGPQFDAGDLDRLDDLLSAELINKVWDISLQLLSERVPFARPLLRLLSYLDQAPAPYPAILDARILQRSELFANVAPAQMRDALNALDNFKLVDFTLQDGPDPAFSHVLTVHPMVRLIARHHPDVLQQADALNALALRLLIPLASDLDPDDLAHRPYWHLLVPHTVRAVLDFVDRPTAESSLLAMELARLSARYLISRGMMTQRFEPFIEPLNEKWVLLGNHLDDPPALALRYETARALLGAGELAEAENVLLPVVAAQAAKLGATSQQVLASRLELARIFLAQGRSGEASAELALVLAHPAEAGALYARALALANET
jgi:hypothetical protein